MALFKRDPKKKAIEQRARWLSALDVELQGLGSSLLAEVPEGWKVGHLDRERFRGGMETYGVAAGDGAFGGEVACGVSTTKSGALEALIARLRGQLAPSEVWVPEGGENRTADSFGSVAALEAAGWEISTDGESYGLFGVDVTGAFASTGEEPQRRVIGVVVGGGRDQSSRAREALDQLVRGELEPTRLWSPV